MAGVNKVILLGRLGKDPEVRNFQSGGKVVNLRVATSETWKDREGERQERTEWHAVSIFNEGLCDVAEKYLRKGDEVYLEGQLETRKWTDQQGVERYTTAVTLRPFNGAIRLLGGRRDGERQDSQSEKDRPAQRGSGGAAQRGGGASNGWTAGPGPDPLGSDDIPF